MKSLFRPLAIVLALVLSAPAAADVSQSQIDDARTEVEALFAETEELGAKVLEAWARQSLLDDEIASLTQSIDFTRAELAATEQKLAELAVEMYMGSTLGASLQILFTSSTQEREAGFEYLKLSGGNEVDVLGSLKALQTELDRQTERLLEASAEQAEVTAELTTLGDQLEADLAEARTTYESLVEKKRQEDVERARLAAEEEERLAAAASTSTTTTSTPSSGGSSSPPATAPPTTAPPTTVPVTIPPTTTPSPPPPSGSGGVCPVAGPNFFTDTWGAPRSGGRTHTGVDIMAGRGTPVVAVYDGTISRRTSNSLGGLTIYFVSDAGDLYYYAHLDDYAPGTSTGQHVTAGTVMGYVGTTGNAPSNAPHLHWAYHPDGGSPVNPTPLARSLCG